MKNNANNAFHLKKANFDGNYCKMNFDDEVKKQRAVTIVMDNFPF